MMHYKGWVNSARIVFGIIEIQIQNNTGIRSKLIKAKYAALKTH